MADSCLGVTAELGSVTFVMKSMAGLHSVVLLSRIASIGIFQNNVDCVLAQNNSYKRSNQTTKVSRHHGFVELVFSSIYMGFSTKSANNAVL